MVLGQGAPPSNAGQGQQAQSQIPGDLQSLLGGVGVGKMAAQGMAPNASSPMGAPQAVDDLEPIARQAIDFLNRFSAALQSRGDEKNAHVVAKCAVTVQGVSLDRKNKIAHQISQGMTGGVQ